MEARVANNWHVPPAGEAVDTRWLWPQLAALCLVARLHRVAADPASLAHQLGLAANDNLTVDDLLRAARRLGLKARLTRTACDRLALVPLPALALMHGDQRELKVRILAKCDGGRVLVQDTTSSPSSPRIESIQEFERRGPGSCF